MAKVVISRAATSSAAPRRPGLALWVVSAAIVLVPVTATGASVALPDIGTSLGTTVASAQWVVNAFFLTFAGFMAISGSLADLTGRRRMFAVGVGLFCAAMLIAALAPSIAVLVGARVVAGIGAAAATTGGSAMLAHAFDGRARSRAFAVFGTAIGLGLAFGPLIAGVLVTSLGSWRAFFFVAAVVLLPLLALTPLLGESRDPHPAGPDWAGAVTFTGGLTLFVLGMVEGSQAGWDSPLIIGSFIAAAALIVAFVLVERRQTNPMIDVSLLAEPRFVAICVMPVLLAFGFVALLVMLPPYFIAVDGISAQAAGLVLVLLTGPTLIVPVLIGAVAHRLSQRLLLVGALAFVGLGAAWLAIVVRPPASILELAGPMIAIGIGFGISLAILDGAAVSSVDPSRAGMAAGVFNTMRLTGEAVAIACLGAILTSLTQSRLTSQLAPDIAATVTSLLLQGNMSGAVAAVTSDPARTAAVQTLAADAYTDALRVGLWSIAALSLVGTVLVGLLATPRAADAATASP